MKIFDIYFYASSILRFDDGSVSLGALGFFWPNIIIESLIEHFFQKWMLIKISNGAGFCIVVMMTFFVFLYYKHNDRGKKIIAYYKEHTKIGKWYFTLFTLFSYYIFFAFVGVGGEKIIDFLFI